MDLSVIEKLRRKPIGALTDEEQTRLLEWLLANGYEDEYQSKLASIRQFDRGDRHGEIARDRTLLPKPETETEVTVQGPSALFEHPRETPSPVSQPLSSLMQTNRRFNLGWTTNLGCPLLSSMWCVNWLTFLQRWRMMFEKRRQFRLMSTICASDVSDFSEGRATTPVIIRPRVQPRRLETVEEPHPQIIVAPSSPDVPLTSPQRDKHTDLSEVGSNAITPVPTNLQGMPTQNEPFLGSDIDTGPVRTRSTTWRILAGSRFVVFRQFLSVTIAIGLSLPFAFFFC